jgi:hypothetical protein
MTARRDPLSTEAAAGKWRIDEDVLKERVLKRCLELKLPTMHIPKVRNPRGGWYTPYDKDSTGKGWLDVTICGLWLKIRELKVEKGQRVEPEQRKWIADLEAAGVDVGIWYLADWNSGQIEEQLCALAGGVPIGRCKDGSPSWIYQPNAFGGGMRPSTSGGGE